jgi:hypothetical protein
MTFRRLPESVIDERLDFAVGPSERCPTDRIVVRRDGEPLAIPSVSISE